MFMGLSPVLVRVWGDLEFDLQAVVGEADVGWEGGFGGGVVEVVAHVGEEGAAGLELFDEGDGLVEVGVAEVGLAAEGVEDEDVEVLEERDALGGDVAHVGEVGGGAEAVAGDVRRPWVTGIRWKLAPKRSKEAPGVGSRRWIWTRALVG